MPPEDAQPAPWVPPSAPVAPIAPPPPVPQDEQPKFAPQAPGAPPRQYAPPFVPNPPRQYVPKPRRPPEQPPVGVRWGLPDAAVVLGLFAVVVLLGYGYLLLRLPAKQGPFELVFGVIAYGLLVAALVVISRRRGLKSLRADFGLWFRPVDLAIGLGIGILVRILSVIEGLIVVAIAGKGPTRGNVDFGTDPLWIILNGFVIAALVAPVVEELVFRGLVLRAVRWAVLRGRRSSPRAQPASAPIRNGAAVLAVAVSALLFAAAHLYESIGDPILLIVLGLFTVTAGVLHGLITIATGRLGPAIIAHVVVNGSSALLVLLLPHH